MTRDEAEELVRAYGRAAEQRNRPEMAMAGLAIVDALMSQSALIERLFAELQNVERALAATEKGSTDG
jgi:hypothetical protein